MLKYSTVIGALFVAVLASASLFARLGWPFETFVHFRAHYVAILAVFVGYALYTRRYRLALPAFVVLAVNIAFLAPLVTGNVAASSSERDASYRAISANVFFGNDNYEEVMGWIRSEDPDVFAIMESTQAWHEGMRDIERDYPYQVSYFMPGGGHGNVLYSRTPLEVLPRENVIGSHRPAVAARTQLGGRSIIVAAFHPEPPGTRGQVESRDNDLRQLARFVRAQEEPVLVLGDFNASVHSPSLQDFERAADMRNARNGLDMLTATYFGPLGIPIDHIFGTKEFSFSSFSAGPHSGSDHRPIVVEFSL